MKEIIIHIGSGKTGSSSIQRALFKSLRKNEDQSITYPLILERKSTQIFCFGFSDFDNVPSKMRKQVNNDQKSFKKFQQSIRDEFKAKTKDAETVLVSSEYFFRSTEVEISRLKTFLKSLGFTSFKIILYVRDPRDFYISLVQQSLKKGSKFKLPEDFWYDFKRVIEQWDKAFGHIVVRKFSRDSLVDGDVVADFNHVLDSFGKPVNAKAIKVNESVSAEISQAMQDVFSKVPDSKLSVQQRQSVRKCINTFIKEHVGVGSKSVLKEEYKHIIGNRFKNDILWLDNYYNLKFDMEDNCSVASVSPTNFRDLVTTFDEKLYRPLKDSLEHRVLSTIGKVSF